MTIIKCKDLDKKDADVWLVLDTINGAAHFRELEEGDSFPRSIRSTYEVFDTGKIYTVFHSLELSGSFVDVSLDTYLNGIDKVSDKAKLESQEGTVLADILKRVEAEVDSQHEKWGIQDHHTETWLTILVEEIGEVAKAVLEHKPDDLRNELIQVAAVCVSALYDMDAQ